MIQPKEIFKSRNASLAFIFWYVGFTVMTYSVILFIKDASVISFFGYSEGLWAYWPLLTSLLPAFSLSAKESNLENSKTKKKENIQEDITPKWVIPTRENLVWNGLSTHGTALFLSDAQKEKFTSQSDGLWIGGGFTHKGKYNVLTIAPPQEGKGAGQIIPNLLMPFGNTKRSYVIFDAKGTIGLTADYQRSCGQKIIIIDPYGTQKKVGAKHGITPLSINFLDLLLSIDSNIIAATSRMVTTMLPYPAKEEDNDFTHNARQILLSVILHVMTADLYKDKRNLVTVWKLISNGDWDHLLIEMLDNRTLGGLVQDSARKFANLKIQSERTWGSTIFSLSRAIDWIKDPEIQNCMQQSDFNPFGLADGGLTVYLNLPFDKIDELSVFSRLFFDVCYRANGKPSRKPKEFVYYFIDEAASLGRFEALRMVMAQYPEYNIRTWIFFQNLHQIERIYGRAGRDEILALCNIKTFFGINDIETAKYVSDSLGSRTIRFRTDSDSEGTSSSDSDTDTSGERPTHSEGHTDGTSHTHTSSEHFMEQRLLRPEQVMQEPNIIVLAKGMGNMRLKRWLYYQNPKNIHEQFWYDQMNKNIKVDNPNNVNHSDDDYSLPPNR